MFAYLRHLWHGCHVAWPGVVLIGSTFPPWLRGRTIGATLPVQMVGWVGFKIPATTCVRLALSMCISSLGETAANMSVRHIPSMCRPLAESKKKNSRHLFNASTGRWFRIWRLQSCRPCGFARMMINIAVMKNDDYVQISQWWWWSNCVYVMMMMMIAYWWRC